MPTIYTSTADTLVQRQSHWKCLNLKLTASRLLEQSDKSPTSLVYGTLPPSFPVVYLQCYEMATRSVLVPPDKYLSWVIICSSDGLSQVRHQAITWFDAHLLMVGPLGKKMQFQPNSNAKFHLTKSRLQNIEDFVQPPVSNCCVAALQGCVLVVHMR